MDGFVSEQKCFESDALFNGEPVQGAANRGDVLTRASVCQEASGRILYDLQLIEGAGGDTGEEGVAVVEARVDEGMDEGFSSRE